MEDSRNKQFADIDEFEQEERKSAVSLSDVFYTTLRHWPWIILSVFICLGLATLYILCTHKVYSSSAEILVKDESKTATGAESSQSAASFKIRQIYRTR